LLRPYETANIGSRLALIARDLLAVGIAGPGPGASHMAFVHPFPAVVDLRGGRLRPLARFALLACASAWDQAESTLNSGGNGAKKDWFLGFLLMH
jgi:hypothetical protein